MLTQLARLSESASSQGGPTEVLLTQLGDVHGETWQHLYGLTLDTDHSLDALVEVVADTDQVEFRRTLLGATAWSWVNIAGEATLDAAVAGDPAAIERLLSLDRYYSGRARDSLSVMLTWTPEETRRRYLESLQSYRSEFGAQLEEARRELAALESMADRILEEMGAGAGIAKLTGYRYVPEPEADRVAVLLHRVDGSLCLAQHDGTRLIVHGTPSTASSADIVDLGRALADENRTRLLQLIASGPTELGPLLEQLGLTRSTVHHHLSILRRVGLVEVEGNAGAYRYRLRSGAEDTLTEAWQRLIDNRGKENDHQTGSNRHPDTSATRSV